MGTEDERVVLLVDVDARPAVDGPLPEGAKGPTRSHWVPRWLR
jgi:hypothetical protein